MAALALDEACISIYGAEFDSGAGAVKQMVGLRFLINTMRREGWCPSSTTRLFRLGNREFAYLGYTYGRVQIPDSDHSQCTDFCNHNLIAESQYQPRHTREGCACQLLEVDRFRMESIIESGKIPVCRLLRIEQLDGEPPKLAIQVEAASEHRPFIAVSHVWAHGWGNPLQNGLPTCSVIDLQKTIDGSWHRLSTQGIVHPRDEYGCVHGFWMDTLCVPVHPNSRYLRKRAIAQMSDIYGGAAGVMVLDQVLLKRPTGHTLPEMLIAIALSPWAGRLWTLQEAVLAKRVHVLLESGNAVDIDMLVNEFMMHLTGRTNNTLNTRFYSTIAQTVIEFWRSIRPYTSSSVIGIPIQVSPSPALSTSTRGIKSASAATILTQLPLRSTSRPSDETVCIATLLGMDVMRLLEIETESMDQTCEKRMIRLLSDLTYIPCSLIFSPGPKLSTPGFRWAPRTLLQRQSGDLSAVVHPSTRWYAQMNPSGGLSCVCDALILRPDHSNEDIANADQFLLFEAGVFSKGPVWIANPPNEEYHRRRISIPSADPSESSPLLVILIYRNFDERVATTVMMGLVRNEAAISSLMSEWDKSNILGPEVRQVRFGKDETEDVDGQSSSTVTIRRVKYKQGPDGEFFVPDGHNQFVVECLKVMVGVRVSTKRMEDIDIKIPGRLVQSGSWLL
ncbi:hypothetical protein LY78DRAFT_660871, partial [Colletotrichum sublineola]